MKDNQRVSQDKKAPMDTTTKKINNNSSEKEDNKNSLTERTQDTPTNKTTKIAEKFNPQKGKTPSKR